MLQFRMRKIKEKKYEEEKGKKNNTNGPRFNSSEIDCSSNILSIQNKQNKRCKKKMRRMKRKIREDSKEEEKKGKGYKEEEENIVIYQVELITKYMLKLRRFRIS